MASGPTAVRRHRRRLLEITFVVGSFVAAGLIAAGVVAGADQPSIASDRSDYAPGDTVVLSGSGWAADETVHVVVDDDQSDAWSHEADVVAAADGTVSDSFDLPALAGTFAITASATSGSASANFTATAPTPPPPAPAGTPTLDSDEETYAPGDTVTLTGSDWQAGDTVHVAVNDDGSDAWDHSADVTVAADGTVTDTFDLPDGLAGRVHRHGHRSRRQERDSNVYGRIGAGRNTDPGQRRGDVRPRRHGDAHRLRLARRRHRARRGE